jgi:hypothetical protein
MFRIDAKLALELEFESRITIIVTIQITIVRSLIRRSEEI